MSYNTLRSKLDRAIAAYLVQVGVGGPSDVLPQKSVKDKSYPITIVNSTLSKPEVPMTGLRRIMVHIIIRGSAANNPNEPNPEQARIAHDQRIASTYDALMQSDDGETLRATADAITAAGRALAVPVDGSTAAALLAANNSDMTEFTCQAVYDAGEGDGEPDEDGTSWEDVLMFEVLCSASNVD